MLESNMRSLFDRISCYKSRRQGNFERFENRNRGKEFLIVWRHIILWTSRYNQISQVGIFRLKVNISNRRFSVLQTSNIWEVHFIRNLCKCAKWILLRINLVFKSKKFENWILRSSTYKLTSLVILALRITLLEFIFCNIKLSKSNRVFWCFNQTIRLQFCPFNKYKVANNETICFY